MYNTQVRRSRRNYARQRRVLLRHLLRCCTALLLFSAAYRFFRPYGGASSAQAPHSELELPRVIRPAEYLQMSTHNTALDRRFGNADQSTPTPPPLTPLDQRVNDVLQRRWPRTAGASAARPRPVRVRVVTVANRVDFTVCAAQASALASGVNMSLLGFVKPYSHITRLKTVLDFAEKEGLADEDAVIFVDSDVLWTGLGLEDALAKFVAFSPPTQASLWPAAVRAWEDYGEYIGERFLRSLAANVGRYPAMPLLQLPPVLFSAERYCNWMQYLRGVPPCKIAFSLVDYITELVRNGHSDVTSQQMEKLLRITPSEAMHALQGVQRFLAGRRGELGATSAAQRVKGDPFYFTSNALGDRNVVRFLNGGGMLMRVWALRLYTSVVGNFVETQNPLPPISKDNHGWFCDQSIHGPIYVRGRMFEAAHALLEALPGAEKAEELTADPPYGLPSGMTGLDRRSEFFMNVAGVLMRFDRNYVGTEYYQRYASHLVFRLVWYLRRLFTWWITGESATAVRASPATSASGCALTPLLLRRPPYREDILRGYHAVRDDDADVAVPPVVHIPGNEKGKKYAKILRYMPWRVAARWSRTANETLFRVLGNAEVEVWGPTQRHYLPFTQMCPNISFLA